MKLLKLVDKKKKDCEVLEIDKDRLFEIGDVNFDIEVDEEIHTCGYTIHGLDHDGFAGKAIFLENIKVDWYLGKDSRGQTLLIPCKKRV